MEPPPFEIPTTVYQEYAPWEQRSQPGEVAATPAPMASPPEGELAAPLPPEPIPVAPPIAGPPPLPAPQAAPAQLPYAPWQERSLAEPVAAPLPPPAVPAAPGMITAVPSVALEQPAQAAAGRKQLVLKIGLALAGIVLVIAAYLVAGVLIAGAEARGQADALKQAGTDMTKLDAFLGDKSLRDAIKTDAPTFKAAIDAYSGKLTTASATLVSDQDRVDTVASDRDFYSFLTPFESQQVHSHDAKITDANAALADFAKAVAVSRTDFAFYSVFVNSEVDADAADKAAKANDFATATTLYQKATNDLDQSALLMKDSDVAPQFAPLVEVLRNEMRDIAGLASTVQANDGRGALAYLQQLAQDAKTVSFDQPAYEAWYRAKFGPVQMDFRKHALRVPGYVEVATVTI